MGGKNIRTPGYNDPRMVPLYRATASVNRVHLVVKNGDKFPTVPVFSDRPDTQYIQPSTNTASALEDDL